MDFIYFFNIEEILILVFLWIENLDVLWFEYMGDCFCNRSV